MSISAGSWIMRGTCSVPAWPGKSTIISARTPPKTAKISNRKRGHHMAKPLNIGMIGYGFMGRAHSNAYRKVNNFFDLDYQPVLKAVAARSRDKAEAFAARWGYESVETDWRKLVERKDIDAIDICVPNDLHMEIAIAAAKAGKIVLCEKPLARTTKEGEKMVAAV